MITVLHFLPPHRMSGTAPGTPVRAAAQPSRTAAVVAAVTAAHAVALWGIQHLGQRPPVTTPSRVVQAMLVPTTSEPAPAPQPAPAPAPTAKPRPLKPVIQRTPTPPPVAVPAPEPTTAVPSEPEPVAATASSVTASVSSTAATATAAEAAAPPGPPAPPPKIELPSASAAYLNNPPPPYPALSRRLGEEGRVVVRVRIEPDGTASAAEIRVSSGYPRLDEAALTAVRQWRYVPGKRNGVPEAMWFLVPIQFELR